MSKKRHARNKSGTTHRQPRTALPPTRGNPALLPLGALLLAGSMGALAQNLEAGEKTLESVEVKASAELPEAKTSLRASETSIGKGHHFPVRRNGRGGHPPARLLAAAGRRRLHRWHA